MTANNETLAPLPVLRFVDNNGNALVGGLLFTYAAGSTNKQTTYTDATGSTPNTNPIVLNSRGECSCWLVPAIPYKFTLSPANDTDPPSNPFWTQDNIYGIQSSATQSTEWIASGLVPTYVNGTQFTVPGNQTAVFTLGRRIKASVTLGIIYGTIVASAYSSATTVTVSWDQGQLDSGLSIVSYGLLSAVNTSVPLGGFFQQQTYTAFTTGGTPPSYTLTPIPAITAYSEKQRFNVTFEAASVGNDTISINSIATPPNLVYQTVLGTYANVVAEQIPSGLVSDVVLVSATQALVLQLSPIVNPLRSYIAGLTLSTAGSSPTMSISDGQATDSTNYSLMSLNAFTKDTGSWAVGSGNGGKMSAAALTAGWYHFHLIQRVDTGVVDIGFDVSATAPTLPTNYTLFRRIGSAKSDGTNWILFTQEGDYFRWSASVLDVAATNPGTSGVTATLASVPTGVKVKALINVLEVNSGTGGGGMYVSDLSAADETPISTSAPLYNTTESPSAGYYSAAGLEIMTNTSAQIRYRMDYSNGSQLVKIATLGWTDSRGKNL